MDPSKDDPSHAAAVDSWIAAAIERHDLSAAEVVDRFRVAFEALWGRAVTTLGAVTLTAIAERVLSNASVRYGCLSVINPRPNVDTRWRLVLRDRLAVVPRADLLEGLRFGLTELLMVIGRLTAEILTPELHAALRDADVTAAPTPAGLHAVPTAVSGKTLS